MILPFLLLTGCVSQAMLAADHETLKKEVADAVTRQRCAPADLAIAESNLLFAEIELDEGDTRRASDHIVLAREHVKVVAGCPARLTEAALANATPMGEGPSEAAISRLGDSDGDGVEDDEDSCARDPEDLDGFKDADGCPDPDNDGDGTPDLSDKCVNQGGPPTNGGCPTSVTPPPTVAAAPPPAPATTISSATPNPTPASPAAATITAYPPETTVAVVPPPDSDYDGILDANDRCPNVPENKNGYADADGCADVPPQLAVISGGLITIKKPINFAQGQATLLPESIPVLDDVATVLRDNPTLKVEIGGHTDNVGDDAANQQLSQGRAQTVYGYLMAKGVEPARMTAVGFGETRPIDTNMTEAGRSNNRRIEFVLVY